MALHNTDKPKIGCHALLPYKAFHHTVSESLYLGYATFPRLMLCCASNLTQQFSDNTEESLPHTISGAISVAASKSKRDRRGLI